MLIDDNILKKIIDTAEVGKIDIVFEVGTGNGILTAELCKRAYRVVSCEVDNELVRIARRNLTKCRNLVLVNGDGFNTDYDFNVFVSNLPYSKSRAAIEWLAEKDFERAVVLVQKEFAAKLFSERGSNYRAVSALAQYCFGMKQVMHVDKNAFRPRPKVDSILLHIISKHKVNRDTIRSLKLLFSFRGKKVSSALKYFKIDENLSDKRVEKLTAEEAVRLAEKLARERLLQTI